MLARTAWPRVGMTRLVKVVRDVSSATNGEFVGYVASVNWAVATYDSAFGYVSAYGAPLVDLLDPQPDEKIIDLGCGAGRWPRRSPHAAAKCWASTATRR